MNSEKTILQDAVADLFPGTFALVMATGIISIAADLLRWPILPRLFFLLNIFFYAALWVLFVIRGIFFAPRLRADFSNPVRGVGFFTVVAATCILGSEAFLIACDYGWSFALLVLGGILWAVLTYGLFAALVTAKEKPAFTASIHGSWLIAVVAAQSVSVLAGLNAGRTNSEALLLFSVL
ncbi:MAG TPA: C4-dicarboxylate ABC transporter, partial [Thermodesulfobacteriota bacterium]|nr:C4-dicarboxylate ABC transporter [Thermodesulfobacteriota bacterium]